MGQGAWSDGTTTILDCSGVGPGGITRVLTETARHWPAGHRVELVAAPAGWEPPADRAAEAVVVSRQVTSRHGGGRARTISSAAIVLRRLTTGAARAGSRDTRVLSMSPSAALVGSRLPVTTLLHDLAFKLWPHGLPRSVRRYRQVSYAVAIKRSERLLCVSARTRHDLSGVYGVPNSRSRVWHPGSDLSAAPGTLPAPLARIARRGGRYLVIAGHARHKGVELAIEAVAGAPEFTLAVLTGGVRVREFEEDAARSGAADRILFLDRLPDHEYAAAVAGAAAFLMPSHFEGYGLPAVEALRLGVPVIVSPDPALHEATGGAAIRMDSWTGAALTRALGEIGRPAGQTVHRGRSWREAVEELFALVVDQPPAGHRVPAPLRGA